MKKALVVLLLLVSTLFAERIAQPATKAYISTHPKLKIIDIRTEPEWKQTGIVKNSITLTFFDERGAYNVSIFLSALKHFIKPNETFALICHTGSRTKMVTEFLGQNGFKVIDLEGGIERATKSGLKLVPYRWQ